jgi:DNA-binding NtrC family response regulator
MKTWMSANTPLVSALAVGATNEEQSGLEKIFTEWGWTLHLVRTRSEAHDFLDGNQVGVVISERELPEGGWRDMLDDLQQRSEPPALVVTSPMADEALWAEVLNMGGYDVLAAPLDTEEVTRVVSAAARHFDSERQRRLPHLRQTLLLRAAN